MATKLHELLAAKDGLETQAIKVQTDLKETFEKRRSHFEAKVSVFTPNTEGAQAVQESISDIQTSVTKEFNWISEHLTRALDVSYQVAETNTAARADVVLDNGHVLLKSVPATALLELEKRLSEWVLSLVQKVPTLDPVRGFSPDAQKGEGYYQARPITKTRTKKKVDVLVKYPATKEHPAQTEVITLDEPIGSIVEQEWSSLITPAQKSEILDRCEELMRAVRKARARANEAEVDTTKKIGSKLLAFVFNGNK